MSIAWYHYYRISPMCKHLSKWKKKQIKQGWKIIFLEYIYIKQKRMVQFMKAVVESKLNKYISHQLKKGHKIPYWIKSKTLKTNKKTWQ